MRKRHINKQNVKAVILAGSRDFGRCPLASRLPTALWPVAGRPAIEHLLHHLSRQGIKQATVCFNGDVLLLKQSITTVSSMQLKFLDEPLPVGTAGCVRDAANGQTNALFVVFHAAIVSVPDIDKLIRAHRAGKSDLTVVLGPGPGSDGTQDAMSGIYVCEPSVLEYIPKEGYCDIKEGLIPTMLRAGRTIHTATLTQPTGNFRDRAGYLDAIANYLASCSDESIGFHRKKLNGSKDIWLADSAEVDPGARIYGSAVIMDGANISDRAVIFGPTIIGRNTNIGKNSLIANSVLWDDSQIGENCEIQRCVVDYKAAVPDNSIVEGKPIVFEPKGRLQTLFGRMSRIVEEGAGRLQSRLVPQLDRVNRRLPEWMRAERKNIFRWFAAALIVIAFLWSYWPGIVDLWSICQRSDEYSSGLLVPFLAGYILWSRRGDIRRVRIGPAIWGLFAFVAAQAVRFFGLFFMYGSAERLSIVLSIAALVLLLFGWGLFRKVSPIMLFLLLMLPWPNRVQAAVALPLQSWATSSAMFCLEVLGYEVVREGNIIHIGDATVAVAEACNGLRMITAFFVISGLVVLLVERAWWEKLIVFASGLPIALLCNTVRLAITAVAFTVLKGEHWEKVFHDFGGYAMMPLALAIVVGELWLLAKLTTAPVKEETVIIRR